MKSNRIRQDEDGFTLIEALISMLLLVGVMFALYAVFDAGVRVMSAGTDETEAAERARLGLERMEREIRAAHPLDPASGKSQLFFDRTDLSPTVPPSSAVTFGNDLNGDGKVECPPPPAPAGLCEYITYDLYRPGGDDSDALGKSRRSYRQAVVGDVRALDFEYLQDDLAPATDEAEISVVRISLEVSVEDKTRRLTTSVALRGRAN